MDPSGGLGGNRVVDPVVSAEAREAIKAALRRNINGNLHLHASDCGLDAGVRGNRPYVREDSAYLQKARGSDIDRGRSSLRPHPSRL